MPSSRKEVIVRTFEGTLFPGSLPTTEILIDGRVELLDLEGRTLPIALETIRWIAFVHDFNSSKFRPLSRPIAHIPQPFLFPDPGSDPRPR